MLLISVKNVPKEQHHSHAHSLLRSCLGSMGIDYNKNSQVVKNKLGKPSLADFPHVHYNLTHADGIAACIVSKNHCGIDAEKIRSYRENVVRRVFSDAEKAMFESAPQEQRNRLFFRLWTLKESYVKAIGIGVSYPMNAVEFSFQDNRIISNIQDHAFRQYEIDGEFIVAVCEKL